MTTKTTKTTKSQLSHQQFFKVCEFLRNKRTVIEQEKMTHKQVIAFVANNMDFHVGTSRHWLKNALESLGEDAPEITTRTQSPATSSSIQKIRRAIRHIATELGDPLATEVSRILCGKEPKEDSPPAESNGKH